MEINMLTILIRIAIVGFLTPQGIEFVFFSFAAGSPSG